MINNWEVSFNKLLTLLLESISGPRVPSLEERFISVLKRRFISRGKLESRFNLYTVSSNSKKVNWVEGFVLLVFDITKN